MKILGFAKRARFDCPTNEKQYPWYSSVAPIAWLTERDTLEGEIPLWFYVPLHPGAKLTKFERETLIAGVQTTTRQ